VDRRELAAIEAKIQDAVRGRAGGPGEVGAVACRKLPSWGSEVCRVRAGSFTSTEGDSYRFLRASDGPGIESGSQTGHRALANSFADLKPNTVPVMTGVGRAANAARPRIQLRGNYQGPGRTR